MIGLKMFAQSNERYILGFAVNKGTVDVAVDAVNFMDFQFLQNFEDLTLTTALTVNLHLVGKMLTVQVARHWTLDQDFACTQYGHVLQGWPYMHMEILKSSAVAIFLAIQFSSYLNFYSKIFMMIN
jgi:hypothetical protein